MSGGRVILVGAGPGDPSLIAMKGMEALCSAEVVVYDRLVGPELWMCAPRAAELIDVGKTPGKPRVEQDEINRILIEKARAGKRVVRLKGGDPFVFGRGGEEALALLEAGIPFEVVPGITAGLGACACAGIPVTHRKLASCVTFVTGREQAGKSEGGIDWHALAASRGTLVFYMGVKELPDIASNLLAAGLSPQTPAACVERATTPAQRTVRGSLADIARKAAESGIEPPAVTIVGEVAGLPEELNWFERRPLFGRRIVNTRPAGQALELTAGLSELGAQVLSLPAIEIADPPSWTEVDAALSRLDRFDWVVLTSANAVWKLTGRLAALGRDVRAFGRARVASLGPATSAALRRHAIRPDLEPERFLSAALLDALRRTGSLRGKRVLLPRSSIAGKDLSAGLLRLGADVTEVAIYVTRTNRTPDAGTLRAVRSGECDVVTFTSASTVTGFVETVGSQALEAMKGRVRFASIGPVTTATARKLGIDVTIEAETHTVEGLVKAILDTAGST